MNTAKLITLRTAVIYGLQRPGERGIVRPFPETWSNDAYEYDDGDDDENSDSYSDNDTDDHRNARPVRHCLVSA